MSLVINNPLYVDHVLLQTNKSQTGKADSNNNKLVINTIASCNLLANYNKHSIRFRGNADNEVQKVQAEQYTPDDIKLIKKYYGRKATREVWGRLVKDAEMFCDIYDPYNQLKEEKLDLDYLKNRMISCCEQLGLGNFYGHQLNKQNPKNTLPDNHQKSDFNPMTYREIGQNIAKIKDKNVTRVIADMFRQATLWGNINSDPIEDFVSRIDDKDSANDMKEILTKGLDYEENFKWKKNPDDIEMPDEMERSPEHNLDIISLRTLYNKSACQKTLNKLIMYAKEYSKLNETNPEKENLEYEMSRCFNRLDMANALYRLSRNMDVKKNEDNWISKYMPNCKTASFKDIGAALVKIKDEDTRHNVTRLLAHDFLSESIDNNPVKHVLDGIFDDNPAKNGIRKILSEEVKCRDIADEITDISISRLLKDKCGEENSEGVLQSIIKDAKRYVFIHNKNPEEIEELGALDEGILRQIDKIKLALVGSQLAEESDFGLSQITADLKRTSLKSIALEIANQQDEELIMFLSRMFGYGLLSKLPYADPVKAFVKDIPADNPHIKLIEKSAKEGLENYKQFEEFTSKQEILLS